MDAYSISPDDCLILRAFSRTSTLREAASLLGCDAAVLVRKVRRISAEYPVLQKIKGRWTLTEFGKRAVQWVEGSIASQKSVLSEKPTLRMATTMWMAEQILVPGIPKLSTALGDELGFSMRTPANIEEDLLGGLSDLAVCCHAPHDPALAHRKVTPENWVVIVPGSWQRAIANLSERNREAFLVNKLFVRHASLNPSSTVEFGSDAEPSSLVVDNLISVRSAVEAGLGWSCVPEILVRSALKHGTVCTLDVPVKVRGHVCIWWVRARKDTEMSMKVAANWLEKQVG